MTPALPSQPDASSYIHGNGEMADRIRLYPWEKSTFGPIGDWPLELLTLVNLMLASREIMAIFWGPDRLMLYNDAYTIQLGPRHPALGQPLREVWPEVVEQVEAFIIPALQEGTSSYLNDTPLTVYESGQATKRFYSASFAPVWVRQGSAVTVQGVFQTAINNTAKIQAQRRLQASEARASQILHSIADAVIVTDTEDRVQQMNPVAEELTGWAAADAKGLRSNAIYRLLTAETRESLRGGPAQVARQLGESVILAKDVLLIARDGTERYISDSAAPILGEDGVVSGVVIVFRDVSETRHAQGLKEQIAIQQRFLLQLTDAQRQAINGRQIMQISAEMLGMHLNAGRVGYSEAAADLKSMHFEVGWAQGDLQVLSGSVPLDHWSKQTFADFSHGRVVVYSDVRTEPSLIAEIENYEAVGAVSVVAVPFLRRGLWRGSLYVNDPEPRHWTPQEISLIEEVAHRTADAMERDQAESELRSLAERLGLAQQAGRMASWYWNTMTGEFVWDGGSELTYGRPPAEMTHPDLIFSYLHEEDREKVRHDLIPVLEGTGEYRSEFRVWWPDGTLHWLQAFGRTIWSAHGKPVGVVGINVNVTEQKKADAALVQTEKLAAVGRLASTMAHEINNPLEAVTNLLYLARQSGSMLEARPFLETADAELRRAANITSQALRFHKQATRPTLSTYRQLTHELFKGRHTRLRNAGARYEERDRTMQPVLCFEGEIRQVLNNLVSNAIDALSAKGGTLFLRGKDGTDWKTGRPGMVITLADTGSGMSETTQRKLFDAFYTTKGIGGTGLGLWVSKEIIERHGGVVHLKSREGSTRPGTIFTIFLPYKAVIRNVVLQ